MQACRQILHNGARQLYEGYRGYALTTPASWMQSIDSSSVRQVLPYVSCDKKTLLLLCFWQLCLQSQHSTCSRACIKARDKVLHLNALRAGQLLPSLCMAFAWTEMRTQLLEIEYVSVESPCAAKSMLYATNRCQGCTWAFDVSVQIS